MKKIIKKLTEHNIALSLARNILADAVRHCLEYDIVENISTMDAVVMEISVENKIISQEVIVTYVNKHNVITQLHYPIIGQNLQYRRLK